MKSMTLKPIRFVQGQIHLPGSKSISNRMLLLAALARGRSDISNILKSDDTRYMIEALNSLGVSIDLNEAGTECRVLGMGGPFSVKKAELFLGNSGTTVRSLCAALCLGQGQFELKGEPRMHERPIADLVTALRQAGAHIEYTDQEGFLPLMIYASGLNGGRISVSGQISSQYLTALLMAAPLTREGMQLQVEGQLVSKPYIDMTINVMRRFGVSVENDSYSTFSVKGGQEYKSVAPIMVEGDASSATYFLSAAAIRGGTVRVYGVGRHSVQGDAQYADILERMGAIVDKGDDWIEVKRGQELAGVDLDLNHMPDAAMTLAVTGLFAREKSVLRNIGNWRVKETDRLKAMARELRKVGAQVNEGEDYLEVVPPQRFKSAVVDTYDDHRMAMSLSLAALGDQPITINDPECTAKTFPNYFEMLKSIVQK